MLGGKSKVVLIIAYAGDPRSHNVVAANKTGGCPCRFPASQLLLLPTPVKRTTKHRDSENSQKELFNKLLLNTFCML
jgi:hypothetical protein